VVGMLASGTQHRGEKILSMSSFGREVKPFAPCRRFATCKRSLNGVKSRHFGKITGPFSLALMGTWRHLAAKLGTSKGNDKLPLRTCLECSVPEPYRSPDWVLVPAETGLKAEY
jgi:hypothetical protein